MPQINRIRVNNVKYNFGTQYYDDCRDAFHYHFLLNWMFTYINTLALKIGYD